MSIILEIDNKEYKVANSYEELSMGQYIEIIKQGESGRLDGYESEIEMITILSEDKSIKDLLWSFNNDDFNELKQAFSWVMDVTIINDFENLPPKEFVLIDGKKYGIVSNYNNMSLGELISFETLNAQTQSDLHRLEIAFGLILRPMDENGKLVNFSQDVFNEVISNKYNINMMDIYSAVSFFLSGEKKSTTGNTKRFSIRQV